MVLEMLCRVVSSAAQSKRHGPMLHMLLPHPLAYLRFQSISMLILLESRPARTQIKPGSITIPSLWELSLA